MEYGIGVRNRYELFYDEIGDPLELIAKQEAERKKAQAEKKSKVSFRSSRLTQQASQQGTRFPNRSRLHLCQLI